MNTVKTYSGKLTLPVYPLGAEDREPPLLREFTPRGAEIYPYTTREILGGKSSLHDYAALYLENDYLKLTFLPELNGRLYSAFDKINGHELFYANPAIKPGLFAVRGAWAAVGVEFNFPNSHTSTTLDPVHCETRQYDDGSASVLAGDIEWTCRMGWCVEIRLYPDSSAIFMESKLYNPTDLPHRFYYWVNAACPVYGDSEFIFPPSTRTLLTHPPMDASRLARLDYPVHEGVDIRFFRNIKQQFPVFAENMDEDFFGLYHHQQDYGVAHVADHALVRGRKLWTFGTARDGRIFIDQLSDTGADYCELQTGPFSLQSDYRMLQPGRMHIQRESWLPVAHTGGFNLACREFAAKIIAKNNNIEIKLCAAVKLRGANVAVVANGAEILASGFDAEPCRTVTLQLKTGFFDTIVFRDAGGIQLAVFSAFRPESVHAANDDSAIAGPPHLRGKYLEEQGFAVQAERVYDENSDDNTICALKAAQLAFERGCFGEAEQKLSKLIHMDRNNPELLLLWGLLQYRNGNLTGAKRAFSRAADDNRFRDRAVFYLAYCATSDRDYRRALALIDEIIQSGTPDSRTLRLQAFCMEHLGLDSAPVKARIRDIFTILPLMEQVAELIGLRHFAEAAALLSESAEGLSALGRYYRGWLGHMLGDESQSLQYLHQAANTAWTDRFSFRLEDEPVLRHALRARPDDGAANYQLGCLLASKNRWDEAASFWIKDASPLYRTDTERNLAIYYWKIRNDRKTASEYFRKAAFADDAGSRTLLEAEMFFEEIGEHAVRMELFGGKEELLKKDSRLKLALVKAMLDNDQTEKAFDLLVNGNFRLCEGKMLSRRLYEKACSVLAQKAAARDDHEIAVKLYLNAAEYPENIGLGKPSGNKEAQWYFHAGNACLKLGLAEKAGECFRRGAEKGDWLDINFFPLKKIIWEAPWEKIDAAYWKNIFFRSCCLEQVGRCAEAASCRKRFEDYMRSLENTGRQEAPEWKELKNLVISS